MELEKKIFYILGKSASGKDSVYAELKRSENLKLKNIIPYTTRPIREGERDGQEYFFCDEEKARQLEMEGRIIELREYQTVYGPWKYFTAYDNQFQTEGEVNGFLMIGTLEGYLNVAGYFGKDSVVPIYLEVADDQRLLRAIAREQHQEKPGYEELCRRFLTDQKDFSEEKLKKAEIIRKFHNEDDAFEETMKQIRTYILEKQ